MDGVQRTHVLPGGHPLAVFFLLHISVRDVDINSKPSSTEPTKLAPLAIITGASGGLGFSIAQALAKRGMRTLLIARSSDKLQAHAAKLSQYAPSEAVTMDLNDTKAIAPTMKSLLITHGPAAVLVNNAGFGIYKTALDLSVSERDAMLRVNLVAAMEMTCAALPAMLEHKQGHVINIASIAAKFGPWGHSAYAASKAGLIAWTQSLSIEYAKRGVHFSYVNPGLIDTNFFDEPAYQSLFNRLRKHVISPELAASRVVSLLDRPKLELCIPRKYRFLDAITMLSPQLTRWVVKTNSAEPTDK